MGIKTCDYVQTPEDILPSIQNLLTKKARYQVALDDMRK